MSKTYISSALRKLIYSRANGCCEYCFFPEVVTLTSHEVDHVVAEKHGGLTEANNLALSCILCNKYKGSDLTSIDPETGEIIPLFNPRKDKWNDNFLLEGADFVPLTAKGRVTIRLLQLNRRDRVEERQFLIENRMFNIQNHDSL
ncbi:MAG: HNH endonuclease [Calothrix sp. SM1_7_51]|nr:HNH endonuclease [Calothrix sp. SM1_7_51]